MSDPYGAPQDDPYRASPWSGPEDRPTQPPPGPAYPPTQPYPPAQPHPQQPTYQPGSAYPTYQPGAYQPGSAYPQPGAYQPGSAYPQPGAYQPGSAYPTYQPGGYGSPPDGRHRRTLIAVLASVAAVLVVGAVVVAVALANSGTKKNSAGVSGTPTSAAGSGSPGSGQSTPSAAPTLGASYTLSAPDRIGALKKASDQSEADDLKNSMQGANIGETFAAEYQDTAAGNKPVIVWGATGGLFGILDAQSQLDAFFNGVGKSVSGGTVGTPSKVDPGSVGGTAECAAVTGKVNATLCAWTGGDALVGAIFAGESLAQGGGQMHTILPAIATRK